MGAGAARRRRQCDRAPEQHAGGELLRGAGGSKDEGRAHGYETCEGPGATEPAPRHGRSEPMAVRRGHWLTPAVCWHLLLKGQRGCGVYPLRVSLR